MSTNAYPEPVLWRKSPLPHHATWWSSVRAEAAIKFGHFPVPLSRPRRRADGAPVEIGTRGFDLLLVLLEADGAFVTKRELLNRMWPSPIVSQENLKDHVSAYTWAGRLGRSGAPWDRPPSGGKLSRAVSGDILSAAGIGC